MPKQKESYKPDTRTRQKPYRFDLEVKCQRHIVIMNVLYTSAHGDTPICQIWKANDKAKVEKSTDRIRICIEKTDQQTYGQDRQSDSYIPLKLRSYKNDIYVQLKSLVNLPLQLKTDIFHIQTDISKKHFSSSCHLVSLPLHKKASFCSIYYNIMFEINRYGDFEAERLFSLLYMYTNYF